ncbi:MAG: PriCT-2 domain-containing protein [Selenomonadaceae bacterium]|nr:PriCT-2 domain-containing protein [Selenomonadaceae bacterium]
MLDFISPSSLTYDEWLAVGMAKKNIDIDCSDWEQWSRHDDRFKDDECLYK